MAPAKVQPALLGGVAIGVLSALPVVNLANCCCAWILFGGGLAAYLMQQGYGGRITIGDGAIVGLLAGLIGTIVWAVISIPLNLAIGPFQARMLQRALENARDLPPEARELFEGLQGGGGVMIGAAWLLSFIFMLCVSAVFGLVGGIFGALLFARDVPPPPPSPPPPVTPPPLPGTSGPPSSTELS